MQRERKATDEEVMHVLDNGSLEFHSEGPCFVLDGFKVAVDLDKRLLLTVVPNERRQVINRIKDLENFIVNTVTEIKQEVEEISDGYVDIDIDEYMSGRYFKKVG